MHLRDNNNINNNNTTDTPNLLYKRIHPNTNQYTQIIRFNNDKDNIYDNIIKTINTDMENIIENHNDTWELYNNHIVTHPNINDISTTTSTLNNCPDNCINEQSSSTVIPYSSDPVSLASNASRQSHTTNLTVLTDLICHTQVLGQTYWSALRVVK